MIDLLLSQLEGVQPASAGWRAQCPHHQDRNPSLFINPGEKGWLVYCHTGCNINDIMADVGMRVSQLFYEQRGRDGDTAFAGLRDLVNRTQPPDLWYLDRFDDVAWRALVDQGPVSEDTLNAYVAAGVESYELAGMLFPQAMRYWVILRDGFLHTWLGTAQWNQLRNVTAQRMWSVWTEQERTRV